VPFDLRLIVPAPEGPLVLLDGDGRLPSMPADGDDDHATVVAVDEALREAWAFTAPVLETHPRWDSVADGEPVPTLVTTEPAATDWGPPAGLAYRPIPDDLESVPESLRPRARELLAEIRTGAQPPELRPRWARRGWHDRASAWMNRAAAAAGRPLVASPRPFFLRGISALLRAPSADRDLFLKAVFPPFHAEPVITHFLAERFPEAVPRVVAIEEDEGWLLIEDVEAPWIGSLPLAERMAAVGPGARSLVAIQRDMARRPADLAGLARAGAPSRPLGEIPDELDRALGPDGLALPDEPIAPDRRAALVRRAAEAVDRLVELDLPESLVHGDFHSLNVALADDRSVIIDWSDAAIGSPLVDLVTWIAWTETDGEAEAAAEGWLEAWSEDVDVAALRDRLDDVIAAGAAFQVISYDGIGRALEPATRYTMAGGGDNFLRRLEEPRLTGRTTG
jgi:aminoglycoside phosphotransferase (APT) family kinase protein